MFTNLIESSAHGREFKRRSSFFLATIGGYALVLFAAGIVGIITYDAQVEAQTTDIISEVFIPAVKPEVVPDRPRDASHAQPKKANAPVDRTATVSERTAGVTTTNDPYRVPENVGLKASEVPPVSGSYRISTRNVDPPQISPDISACINCTGVTPKVEETTTPPTPPKPKPTTLRVSPKVISSKVVSLPKPIYPVLAKAARVQGSVNVQILIDESGRVISAQAVQGSPMLTPAAVEAARRARFTPTKLGDDPVKVQGVITYHFILQ